MVCRTCDCCDPGRCARRCLEPAALPQAQGLRTCNSFCLRHLPGGWVLLATQRAPECLCLDLSLVFCDNCFSFYDNLFGLSIAPLCFLLPTRVQDLRGCHLYVCLQGVASAHSRAGSASVGRRQAGEKRDGWARGQVEE